MTFNERVLEFMQSDWLDALVRSIGLESLCSRIGVGVLCEELSRRFHTNIRRGIHERARLLQENVEELPPCRHDVN